MRKLILNPEDLVVESFSTARRTHSEGTVRARGASDDPCTYQPFTGCVNCNTIYSCPGGQTCFDSCGCGVETETCDIYCNVSAGTSCNPPCLPTCGEPSCNVQFTCHATCPMTC
jgi:hypothetical protein